MREVYLKTESHCAICMVRFFYCTEFKTIHESVDLKGVVCDQSHHVKSESDGAICLIRSFRVMVLSSKH